MCAVAICRKHKNNPLVPALIREFYAAQVKVVTLIPFFLQSVMSL